jgi:hypothetical protein
MIKVNDRKYAKNKKEFSQSLFEKSGTCDGYYKVKRKKNGILVLLSDTKGEDFAYVVRDNKGGYGMGTKHGSHYMYDLTDYHRRQLGVEGLGYGAMINLSESIINQIKKEVSK